MKFDMSAAWNDAMGLMRGNREVLAVVAGVFFLLPSLVMAVLFADEQAEAVKMLEAMMQGNVLQDEPAMALEAAPGWFLAVGLAAFFVQLIGYLALLALMDGTRRPTVGEAIGTAFKCLLPLIGTVILFGIGYLLFAFTISLALGVVVAGIVAATGSTAVAGSLSAIALLAIVVAIFWVMVRLSLTLAEIVLGDKLNPIRAFAGSWRLTRGNSFRLFLFYLLLAIVYLVIYIVVFGVLLSAVMVAFSGATAGFILGLFAGLIGALFGVVGTAIVAATYHQLAGPSAAAFSQTFE
jgi:hypothetical protein